MKAKISREDDLKIIEFRKQGYTYKAIAKYFNVNYMTIRNHCAVLGLCSRHGIDNNIPGDNIPGNIV